MAKSTPQLLDVIRDKNAPLPQVALQTHYGIAYQAAWDLQTELHQAMVARKRANRERVKAEQPTERQQHHLLFVEHPPVYTLGKSGSVDNLLIDEAELKAQGFSYHKINRGGDITYHGPGQLVVYPIFDLDDFFSDVHRYVRCLEEVIIRTLATFGIADAYREAGYTGVWLPATNSRPKRKICAIGVHLSRWVTLHGLAFNVQPDLSHFKHIIPCGIDEKDRDVTSLAQELGHSISLTEVQPIVEKHFRKIFAF